MIVPMYLINLYLFIILPGTRKNIGFFHCPEPLLILYQLPQTYSKIELTLGPPWRRRQPRVKICDTLCCHFHSTTQLWSQSSYLLFRWSNIWKGVLSRRCDLFNGFAGKHFCNLSQDYETICAKVSTGKTTNSALQQLNFLFVQWTEPSPKTLQQSSLSAQTRAACAHALIPRPYYESRVYGSLI